MKRFQKGLAHILVVVSIFLVAIFFIFWHVVSQDSNPILTFIGVCPSRCLVYSPPECSINETVIGQGYDLCGCPRPSKCVETKQATSGEALKDWKTYTNEEYGFEFRYPAELKKYECSDLALVVFHQSGSMPPCEYIEFPLPVVVSVVEGSQVEGAHYSFSSENGEFQEVSIGPVVVAGIKGLSYTIEHINNLLGSYTLNEARIEKNGKTYVITAMSPTHKEAFDQILSTFEFVE